MCPGGEKMILSSRTAHDSFPSGPVGICFVASRSENSSSVTLKTLSEAF